MERPAKYITRQWWPRNLRGTWKWFECVTLDSSNKMELEDELANDEFFRQLLHLIYHMWTNSLSCYARPAAS